MSDVPWNGDTNEKFYLQSGDFTSTITTSLLHDIDGPEGCKWDGVDTMFCSYQTDYLYVFSGQFTTTVKSSLSVGATDAFPFGQSQDQRQPGNTGWSAAVNQKFILNSGQITSTINTSSGSHGDNSMNGFDIDYVNQDTMASSNSTDTMYWFSGIFTTTVLDTEAAPGTQSNDIGWDGTDTLDGSNVSDYLYKTSGRFTTTVLDSEAIGAVDTLMRGIGSNNVDGRLGALPGSDILQDIIGSGFIPYLR
jgi:hypothetical protein